MERLLLRGEFVPLHNFQPGNVNFRNTCFIAVVANLRHVLQPVMEAVRQYKWKDYINVVRTRWEGEYRYALEHNGQHDAAELLGALLHEHASRFGVELCVTKQLYECKHYTERLEYLAMIVLVLPSEEGDYTLSSLQENYFAPEEFSDLECAECGGVHAKGIFTHIYKRSSGGKLIFRINRYSDQSRRSDKIFLDEKLTFENGDEYNLEAILQHEGQSVHGGHYIIFLFLNGCWECRDDGSRTVYEGARMPPYTPENVYVVVYGISPQDVSEGGSNIPHDHVAEARRPCEPDLDATVTDYGHNSLLDKPNTDPFRFPFSWDDFPEEPHFDPAVMDANSTQEQTAEMEPAEMEAYSPQEQPAEIMPAVMGGYSPQEQPEENSPPGPAPNISETGGAADSGSEFNSEISEHAEDGDEDLLTVRVDPSKSWLTLEDADLERIERLAQCLRCDPLCPPPLQGFDGTKSVKAVEGLNLPLVHCAFDGCSWVSEALPCRRVSVNAKARISCVVQGEWSTVACREKIDDDVYGCCGNETCLKEHIVGCHRDVISETCGQDITHP